MSGYFKLKKFFNSEYSKATRKKSCKWSHKRQGVEGGGSGLSLNRVSMGKAKEENKLGKRSWLERLSIYISTLRLSEYLPLEEENHKYRQREEKLGVQVSQAQGPRFDPSNVWLWS